MQRVVAYVDGYNLYYGLREKGWKRFYWLNVQAMVASLLKPKQTLVFTKYFTSIVKYPAARHARQAVFLDALRTLDNFEIYYGHFLADRVVCRNCGHMYETHHEKMTDVNIATELMTDAFQDRFDMALLMTADSDLAEPVQAVRRLFTHACGGSIPPWKIVEGVNASGERLFLYWPRCVGEEHISRRGDQVGWTRSTSAGRVAVAASWGYAIEPRRRCGQRSSISYSWMRLLHHSRAAAGAGAVGGAVRAVRRGLTLGVTWLPARFYRPNCTSRRYGHASFPARA